MNPKSSSFPPGAAVALLAFAANSVFCRLALGRAEIDAATFTLLRLLAGAVTLALLCGAQGRAPFRRDVPSAAALFAYAAAFSFAYRELTAGTGALLLFGTVQVTMIGTGLFRGERPGAWEWSGLLVALGGLAWLVSPGLAAPPPLGAGLMALAGVAWGVYSLRGRKLGDPLATTAGNFVWAVPLGLLLFVAAPGRAQVSAAGVTWAVLSGALASGAGYAVWYAALPRLTATRAATLQLTVPVLAALGGVLFLAETLSARLVLASVLVLGGVALAIAGRRRV
ncbi:DMT family transporter [Opitutus sp. GAS368]|uniref:DMT family transporter n=1 Tax=Opitutus sp. GAS368 TaxID=1882749 RepID=UPI0031B5C320